MLGIPNGAEISEPIILKAIHPDDRRLIDEFIPEAKTKGQENYEFELRTLSQEWIYIKCRVYYRETGEPLHAIGVAVDITDKKHAIENLRKNEDRYSRLTDNAQDVIFRFELLPQPHFSFVSQAVVDVTGYTPEENYANPDLCFRMIYPCDMPLLSSLVSGISSHRAPLQMRLVRKDGDIIWIEPRLMEVLDKSGRLVAVEGTVREITEYKKLEQELTRARDELEARVQERTAQLLEANRELMDREKELSRLASIVESSSDAIISMTRDGIITSLNSGAEKLYGYPAHEALGKHISLFAPADRRSEIPHILEKAWQGECTSQLETVRQRKDGKLIDVSLTVSCIRNRNRELLGISTIAHDITVRKRAEEALKENDEKIRKSLKEKTLLLKEVHHRVKNNLQLISSMLSIQARYLQDGCLVEPLEDCIHRVRSMALVHEILYSSGNMGEVSFEDYIKRLVKYMTLSMGSDKEKIRIGLEADEISLGIDKAVPCGLIMNELVSNSIKHAFPGRRKGEVKIEMHAHPPDKISIVVRDNGVGLPEEVNIQEAKTMGINLVIALVDQLKGTVEVHRDSGTEFKILFRASKSDRCEGPAEQSPDHDLAQGHKE